MSEQLVQISKSSAARTSFVHEAVDVGGGRVLHVDGNSKITAGNGTYEEPRPNALSLVQVEDCPEATPTCKASCYVHGLEKHARDLHDLYRENSRTIRDLLEHGTAREYREAARCLARWISSNAQGGFRWHVSGDVFALRYAYFIVDVCVQSGSVRHWIYTRRTTPSIIGILLEASPWLTVNLSADKDNYLAMREWARDRRLRLTYMSTEGEVPEDLPPGSVIFPDYGLRGRDLEDPTSSPWWRSLTREQRRMVCPVDFFGKSETLRCGPCRKCIDEPGVSA